MNSIDVASEPELFAVACPKCAAALAVGDDLVGDVAICPVCDGRFLVPEMEMPRAPRSAGESVTAEGTAAPAAEPAWQRMATTLAESNNEPVQRHRDMEFREPPLAVETEVGEVELRRLTEEEKRVRRARRNLIMLLAGTLILIVITALLGREKPRKR